MVTTPTTSSSPSFSTTSPTASSASSFFAAALSSKAAELNALASCSTIDFYRYLIRPPTKEGSPPFSTARAKPPLTSDNAPDHHSPPRPPSATARAEPPFPSANVADPLPPLSTEPIENQKSKMGGGENLQNSSLITHPSSLTSDRHYVLASKAFTILWGLLAIAFALFAHLSENLIQAVNIVGSIFYGVVLGLFLIAFFLKFIHGTAAFSGAIIGQTIVFAFVALQFLGKIDISYLWYNLIGCVACVASAVLLQLILGPPRPAQGFPIDLASQTPIPLS